MATGGEAEAEMSKLGDGDGRPQPCVLYPIFDIQEKRVFDIAVDIAAGAGLQLLLVDLVDDELTVVEEQRTISQRLLEVHLDDNRDVPVRPILKQTDDPIDEIVETARAHDTRLIVFDRHAPESTFSVRGTNVAERVSKRVPCNTVRVGTSRDERISAILVPVADGPHSSLAVRVASAIGRTESATLELFHVTQPDQTGSPTELFDRLLGDVPADVDVETWHREGPEVADAIIEQTNHYDMTVLGEPRRDRLRRLVFGSVTETVTQNASNTVLPVRNVESVAFSPDG